MKMVKLFCFLVLINPLLGNYPSISTNEEIMTQILKHESMLQVLSMSPLDDYRSIRVVDKTDSLPLDFQFIDDSTKIAIGVRSFNEVPIDFNTGHYRDICVTRFQKDGDNYRIEIFLSPFYCTEKRKQRLHYYYTVTVRDDLPIVIDFQGAIWH